MRSSVMGAYMNTAVGSLLAVEKMNMYIYMTTGEVRIPCYAENSTPYEFH